MSKLWTYVIAILEMIGGIFGIAFIIWQSLSSPPLDLYNLLFAIIIFLVYALSLAAGIALALRRKIGRVGSIIVQAIQLPKYTSQLLIFMFSFGFDAYPYGMLTSSGHVAFGIDFKFPAYYQLFANVADAPVGFGFSIPACAFLVMLLRKPKLAASTHAPVITGNAPNNSLERGGAQSSDK